MCYLLFFLPMFNDLMQFPPSSSFSATTYYPTFIRIYFVVRYGPTWLVPSHLLPYGYNLSQPQLLLVQSIFYYNLGPHHWVFNLYQQNYRSLLHLFNLVMHLLSQPTLNSSKPQCCLVLTNISMNGYHITPIIQGANIYFFKKCIVYYFLVKGIIKFLKKVKCFGWHAL